MLADTTIENTQETLYTLTDESKWVEIKIFDVEYRLEILRICDILDDVKIQKYMPETKCGFVRYDNKSILTFNIRNKHSLEKAEKVTVLVIKARRNDTIMPIGFIIEDFEDFYNLIS